MKISIILLILTECFLFSCSNPTNFSKDEIDKAKEEIRKTEEAFCTMSVKDGFNHALIAYADSSVIKPSDGELPTFGIEELKARLGGKEITGVITWKPVKIDVAQSCDLGFTFGNWEYKLPGEKGDTTYYGNYFSVWKKQSDGTWKYTLDGGNDTPKPE